MIINTAFILKLTRPFDKTVRVDTNEKASTYP